MPKQNTPIIVAKFDLTDERQRILQRAMERMHSGANALWRALAMRQVGHLIYEAAECLPRKPGKRPRYDLVIWNLSECGVSWIRQKSRAASFAASAELPAAKAVASQGLTG
jgi:hypothetical protein